MNPEANFDDKRPGCHQSLKILNDVVHGSEIFSLWLAKLGGILILSVVAMTAIDILLRTYFSTSLEISYEYTGYVMAAASSFAFPYALIKKDHIRIDIILDRLSPGLRGIGNVLALSSLSWFSGLLSFQGIKITYSSFVHNSISTSLIGTPLWIPQTVWTFGLICFFVVSLILLVHCLAYLACRDVETAASIL